MLLNIFSCATLPSMSHLLGNISYLLLIFWLDCLGLRFWVLDFFFTGEFWELLIYSLLTFYWICGFIFSPNLSLSFHLLNRVFHWRNGFSFDEVQFISFFSFWIIHLATSLRIICLVLISQRWISPKSFITLYI